MSKCDECKYKKESGWDEPCRSCKHTCKHTYPRGDNFEPAEPMVLSVEEILEKYTEKYKDTRSWSDHEVMAVIKFCRTNFRLERDIEYKPIAEAINAPLWIAPEMIALGEVVAWHAKLVTALRNLKPLEEK